MSMVKPGARVSVGLSGGVDSMVLLDVLTKLAPRQSWRLSALHVNHQLSANASTWASFCRRTCRARAIPFRATKVEVTRGNSTEAAARAARYAVYRDCESDFVALAHNQDDQAETLLLRLLRGAGIRGLAAMPFTRSLGNQPAHVQLIRPLLAVSRRDIEAYAKRAGLSWVEDESNSDTQYLRNFLRAEVLPRIATKVPGYRNTLSRAAMNLAEGSALLDDLARMDGNDQMRDGILTVEVLRHLSAPRAANVLRYFLGQGGVRMPDRLLLREALRQVLAAKEDARVRIDLGNHQLFRYGGALYLAAAQPLAPAKLCLDWHGERRLHVPSLNATLIMERSRGDGIDLAKLREGPVMLRLRQGGERLRPDARRPRRRVKDLFQEHGVPPWVRDRTPFLWSGRYLVWVPGLGIDERFLAAAGRQAVRPRWQQDGIS